MSDVLVDILLVEDSKADAYLFRKALEDARMNFRLTVIDDGADALAFARQEAPASSPECKFAAYARGWV